MVMPILVVTFSIIITFINSLTRRPISNFICLKKEVIYYPARDAVTQWYHR